MVRFEAIRTLSFTKNFCAVKTTLPSYMWYLPISAGAPDLEPFLTVSRSGDETFQQEVFPLSFFSDRISVRTFHLLQVSTWRINCLQRQKCLTFIDLIDDHWCVSDSIDAIKINTCGQLNRPDLSLLSLYYHVLGQSSSSNEIESYFVLMNIHKKWSHDRWMNSANYSHGGIISQIL